MNLGGGAFIDPNLPAGLVPFNVQDINGKVYVTYAPMGRSNQTSATAGTEVVGAYDENGVFLQRLITGSQRAAPWGIALTPSGFGAFSGDLLVGNFSFVDSEINTFDPTNGTFLGSIPIDFGSGNTPGGLWALSFGNGGSGARLPRCISLTASMAKQDGLFGAILLVPEPSTIALLGAALAILGVPARKRYQG